MFLSPVAAGAFPLQDLERPGDRRATASRDRRHVQDRLLHHRADIRCRSLGKSSGCDAAGTMAAGRIRSGARTVGDLRAGGAVTAGAPESPSSLAEPEVLVSRARPARFSSTSPRDGHVPRLGFRMRAAAAGSPSCRCYGGSPSEGREVVVATPGTPFLGFSDGRS